MSQPPIRRVLVGKYGVPPDLEEAMRRHGVDPGAAFVDSAEGWRAGPVIDLEERSREADTALLAQEVLKLADEQDGQADAPDVAGDAGA